MKKHLAALALAALFTTTQSQAVVTITLTGNPNTGPAFFVSADAGSPVVLDGSLIRIGTFETAPDAGDSFANYASSFREFGRTTMGNATNVNTGHVVRQNIPGGDAASGSPDPDSFFIGKTIYIWVYSTPGAQDDVSQGVYATTAVFADQPTAVSTSMTTYSQAFGVLPGGTPASVVLNGTSVTRFNLSAPLIPEPATGALALLAAIALGRRRR